MESNSSSRRGSTDSSQIYKDHEEIVITELYDEIARNISPNDVGHMMMEYRLLLAGEFEKFVEMKIASKLEIELSEYLLTCLMKRPMGYTKKFCDILDETQVTHVADKIKTKLADTSEENQAHDMWKNKCKKLENDLKRKEQEIQDLKTQIGKIMSCIKKIQNDFGHHLEKSTNAVSFQPQHPDSQQSDSSKDSDTESESVSDLPAEGNSSSSSLNSSSSDHSGHTIISEEQTNNLPYHHESIKHFNALQSSSSTDIGGSSVIVLTSSSTADNTTPVAADHTHHINSFTYKNLSETPRYNRVYSKETDCCELMKTRFKQVQSNIMPVGILELERKLKKKIFLF